MWVLEIHSSDRLGSNHLYLLSHVAYLDFVLMSSVPLHVAVEPGDSSSPESTKQCPGVGVGL